MKRPAKWLFLLGFCGPAVVNLSCSALMLQQLRDTGIGIFGTVVEAVALDLVDQILGVDAGAGETTP